jgi:hypothetical protein
MLRLFLINKLLGGNNMVMVFVTLIVYGSKIFADVPLSLQDAVRAELLVMGLDENGVPVVTP